MHDWWKFFSWRCLVTPIPLFNPCYMQLSSLHFSVLKFKDIYCDKGVMLVQLVFWNMLLCCFHVCLVAKFSLGWSCGTLYQLPRHLERVVPQLPTNTVLARRLVCVADSVVVYYYYFYYFHTLCAFIMNSLSYSFENWAINIVLSAISRLVLVNSYIRYFILVKGKANLNYGKPTLCVTEIVWGNGDFTVLGITRLLRYHISQLMISHLIRYLYF